ncbi:hypothetical protein [Arcobacter sp. LA11]|uniref:hypothetical protein n=1 Tax=Arcobacter sp. LA11 TaxID=1898176 RepID=UPI000932E6B1|nr:hypothetical protein [Arcobacter sp. LA11]
MNTIEKELKLSRNNLDNHLNRNNKSISVSKNTSNGIILRDLNFNTEIISFTGNDCNYSLIDKDKNLIDSNNIKMLTFNNCSFEYFPIIRSSNIWKVEFSNCNFYSSENLKSSILSCTNKNKKVYFNKCEFEAFHLGDISDIQYNSEVRLSFFDISECEFGELTIENIEIISKFYINKQYDGNNSVCKIEKLLISNSIFRENFKLHHCEVDEINIKDTDFEKNADFYKSHFKSGFILDEGKDLTDIYFQAINFRGLTLFGDTIFDNKFHLKYITLEGASHFRNAKFKKGLDLDYTNVNMDNPINFFGIKGLSSKISKLNTSQETYRVIKYNFEELANKLEANKYHNLELQKHRKNIYKKVKDWFFYDEKIKLSDLLDGIVSSIHWASSIHSSNWLLSLIWIFIVSYLTNLYLFNVYLPSLECMFKYINILSKLEDFNQSYLVMTLNKVSLGYLYYQFLTAVRKDTRK